MNRIIQFKFLMLVPWGNIKVNKMAMLPCGHREGCRRERATVFYHSSIISHEKINTPLYLCKQTCVIFQGSPE